MTPIFFMCNELFDSSHSILNMILRYICDCHYFCQCALFFYVTAIQCDSSFGSLYLLQLSPGHIYNIGAAEQAVKHIKSLGLFSSADLIPRPDETKDGGVVVEFQLRELEPRSAGVNTDWSIVPGDQGRPTLVMYHRFTSSCSLQDLYITLLTWSLGNYFFFIGIH